MSKYEQLTKKYKDVLDRFTENLNRGAQAHTMKYEEMSRAVDAMAQRMPDTMIKKQSFHSEIPMANDPIGERGSTASKYMVPIFPAIVSKLEQDLSSHKFRFEWSGNNPVGEAISSACDKELLKTWSYEDNKKAVDLHNYYMLVKGTGISQTTTNIDARKRILPIKENGKYKTESKSVGRNVKIMTYDPSTVVLDPDAIPGRVSETSRWAIVTIGNFTTEYIKDNYGIDGANVAGEGTSFIDGMKETMRVRGGLSKNEKIVVREYYETDGYRYTIVGDSYIVSVDINTNGVADRIPLNVTQCFIDTESPYGTSLYYKLEPAIEVLSVVMNQIIDANKLNLGLPIISASGILSIDKLTTGEAGSLNVVEADVSQFISERGQIPDLNNLLMRFQFPDITQAGMFMYEQAMQHIWFLTGLNPTALSGQQEKQIRVSGVADMVQGSSLRSDSQIVINLEKSFMNPTCWDMLNIYDIYYNDFPTFKTAEIPREFMEDIKNVRVVNGSYLPADDLTRGQKMDVLLQMLYSGMQSLDGIKIINEKLRAMGFDPEVWLRPPEELYAQDQLLKLVELVRAGEDGQAIASLGQMAQQGGK